jgi:hypothetical protein
LFAPCVLLTEAGWDAGVSPQIPLVFTLLVSQVLLLIEIDIFSGPLLIEKLILSDPSTD